MLSSSIKSQSGVVLLEALIALLLFSMGILALAGLQTTMIKNTTETKLRSDASFLAQARIAQMWGDLGNLSAYQEPPPGVAIKAGLPNARRTTTVAARGLTTVRIEWTSPGVSQTHNYEVSTYIGAL